jgi:hypothetical protein
LKASHGAAHSVLLHKLRIPVPMPLEELCASMGVCTVDGWRVKENEAYQPNLINLVLAQIRNVRQG